MALSSLRLRRALAFSSPFFRNPRSFSSITSFSSSSSISSSSTVPQHTRNHSKIQSHSFRSSLPSFSSRSSYNNNDDDKISPDTILFEGCDYNHWLITMDFPKDPKPTPEEMVETYVQTLAKVVGSVEEAKKRMYACSTTTYNGFQAVMTEEMSEKFRGLPGVVFILPDSYIDPVNKEYGGDKYIDGTIIPRPPPVQYGRSQGRYGDRNRNYDRPRYDGQRTPMPMQQGNQQYDRQAPMQGDGRNQPFDRQAPMQGDGRNQPFDRQAPMQGDGRNQPFDRQAPIQGDGRNQPFDRQAPMQGDGRNQPFDRQAPMQGDGRNQPFDRHAPMQGDGRHQPFDRQAPMPGVGGNFGNQQNYTPQPNYGHPGQGARDSMPMGGQDYAPGGFGRDNNQGDRRGPVPPPNFGGADRGSFSQGQRDLTQGDRRVYTPAGQGDFRPPPSVGYGQGDASGFRQGYPGPGEGQSFQQVQSDGRPGFEQGGYNPMGQTRNEQGRY